MTTRKSVVTVMAHPDDAELTCFGTLLHYLDHGYQAHVLIVCTGEHGISVHDKEQGDIQRLGKQLRFQESEAAFAGSGVALQALGYEDSQFSLDTVLISAIEKRLHMIQPTILLTHFVNSTGADHQDHSIVGQACMNVAVRCPSIQLILQAQPLQDIRSQFKPNYFVDITKFFEQKMTALAAHQSQAGRAYLTREYHHVRGRVNALGAGTLFFEQGKLFESFVLAYGIAPVPMNKQ